MNEGKCCETCLYYDTDRDDMPCYSCVDCENYEEGEIDG